MSTTSEYSVKTMGRPRRVFQLIKSLGRGGAETLLPESLRFADRDRFEYGYGYFLPHKDAVVPSLTAQGADVTCFSARGDAQILLSARRVAAHLRQWNADLLHCHLPIAGVVGRLAGRMADVPVIYTEHNKMEHYHPVTRRVNTSTWRLQARAIAVSTDVAESIRRFAAAEVPVEVVLNGVDTHKFSADRDGAAALRAELGIPATAPVIGTVAVFREQKRLDKWLRAAAQIRASNPSAHFIVVGDGPLREELVAVTQREDLHGSVHFPGLRDDVRPYVSAMDVYMMSSSFEGLPVALLEAMSMGRAIVSTAVGGIPEALTDGVNGALVAEVEPELLASRVEELLDRRELLSRYGRAARDTVEERFSMKRMASQLESIYDEVLGQRGAARAVDPVRYAR